MWTNLASPIGDWHALPFEFVEDKTKPEQISEGAILSLVPSATESDGQDETSVYLDVELSDVSAGDKFSFTYRLVRPWGEVQWLGSYGKNGDLVFKEGDTRLTLESGWKFGEGESVISTGGEVEEGVVAKLSEQFEWSSWAFEKDGWPTFSSSAVAPLSSVILLVPRELKGGRGLVVPQPLAVVAEQGAVAVSTTGHVVGQHLRALTMRTVHSNNTLQDILPENLRLIDRGTGDGFASIVSQPTAEADSAVTLSIIPIQLEKVAPVTNVHLDDLVFPVTSDSDAVLVNVSSISGNPDILLLEAGEKKDIVIRLGATGGQVLYTPLHALALPEDESPWKLALLNPYSSAFVELFQEEDDTSLTLPTPPPSPPPTRVSPVSPAVRASPPLSISLPASQTPVEATPKEAAEAEEPASSLPTAEPLTPSSPPPRDSIGFRTIEPTEAAETEVKEEENKVEVIQEEPVRGFMRLVIFWIFRALFERVCGLLAAGARWWGLPRLFAGLSQRLGQEHLGEKGEEKAIEEKREEHVDEEVPAPIVEEKAEETSEETTSVEPEPDPAREESSVMEEETLIQEDKDSAAASESVEEGKPLVITVPSSKAIFETETPTTVIVHKRIPPKPRFLADVHSNFVSLLVRAPHSLAKPDNLSIIIDGKRVSDSHVGYRCAQLSGDFYLLGLQGPSSAAKLEVTVD